MLYLYAWKTQAVFNLYTTECYRVLKTEHAKFKGKNADIAASFHCLSQGSVNRLNQTTIDGD